MSKQQFTGAWVFVMVGFLLGSVFTSMAQKPNEPLQKLTLRNADVLSASPLVFDAGERMAPFAGSAETFTAEQIEAISEFANKVNEQDRMAFMQAMDVLRNLAAQQDRINEAIFEAIR